MESQKQRDLIVSLLEELVIAKGLIKEICEIKGIAEPEASLRRMQRAIEDAKEHIQENK